jgi:putative hydrolase of the HAD superfamily
MKGIMIDWIALDADDTLWKNAEFYLDGRNKFLEILKKYELDESDIKNFDEFEVENIRYFGYGVMSFVFSMIEIAIELTNEKIHPGDIQKLIRLAKDMLFHEVVVFEGVIPMLKELSAAFPLMLITKGDLQHQKRKFEESRLAPYFQAIEVVSDKTSGVYSDILQRYQINPDRFLMIGNSLRSDVQPVLELGGWAIHLSNHNTWAYEDHPSIDIPKGRFFQVQRIEQVLPILRDNELIVSDL